MCSKYFKLILGGFILQTFLISISTSLNQSTGCINGRSSQYNGTINVTVSGRSCQRWDQTTPHRPIYQPFDGSDHNYCRNPDNDLHGVWCYTSDPDVRWESCGVSKCYDDSKIVWTNYDEQRHFSNILWIHADPELIRNNVNHSGYFNVSVLLQTQRAVSQFWAVAGDYHRNVLFYTDYSLEYIGVSDLNSHNTKKEYQGMAHGVESLAYDWVSKNLYWTDSQFKWIMAVDKDFLYYTPVYRSRYGDPHALTIHAKKRKLFFSIYKSFNTTITSTDLAGLNEKVLFRYPEVNDVTGLTIDYTDNRLYWTDFVGYGSKVVSSNLDGEERIKHVEKKGSWFWKVAAYMDYIYVTDITPKNVQETSRKTFNVWLIAKQSETIYQYSLKGQPRGITVMSENEGDEGDIVSDVSECHNSSLPPCQQICLPRVGAVRECGCSLGYMKEGETKCTTRTYEDGFLLVANSAQGNIFQIPLDHMNQESSNYSIVHPPENKKMKVGAVAVDSPSREIYWVDRISNSVERASLDGTNNELVSNSADVSSLVVDPCSKNIFYINSYDQSINVMDSNGTFKRNLMQIKPLEIWILLQVLAQDRTHRKLYWTQHNSITYRGSVWRMDFDGSNKELVYDSLKFPRGIAVDHKRGNLLFSEVETATIFVQPLSKLLSITNTSVDSIMTRINMSSHLEQKSALILDIQVSGDFAYFSEGNGKKIKRFNSTLGPSSVTTFGPSEFGMILSMAIYSPHDDYNCNRSPCSSASACKGICVTIGSDASAAPMKKRCMCSDGPSSEDCKNMTWTSSPPNCGSTCPSDITIDLGECQDYVESPWTPPQWIDDDTSASELKLENSSTSILSRGLHTVKYLATDKHGFSSVCLFSANVKGVECGTPPLIPNKMTSSTPSCGHRMGSSYALKCSNPEEDMQIKGDRVDQIVVKCNPMGQWMGVPVWKEVTCEGKTLYERTSVLSLSVGITISIFILILIAVFVIVIARRRGSLWLQKRNFPCVWKQKEDTTTNCDAMEDHPLHPDLPSPHEGDTQTLRTLLGDDVSSYKIDPSSNSNHKQFSQYSRESIGSNVAHVRPSNEDFYYDDQQINL